MSLGPVELLIVQFPQSQLKGDIVPAIRELVDGGIIRVIDILFLKKDGAGQVTTIEFSDLDADEFSEFDALVSEVMGLISDDDVKQLAAGLENNTSAGLMLFENTWATRFQNAVANVRGKVLLNETIPHAVIEQVLAEKMQVKA